MIGGIAWRRKLTKFELVLALLLIGGLIRLALFYTERTVARAEHAHVLTTVAVLNTQLNVTAYRALIRREYQMLAALDGSNPMAAGDEPSHGRGKMDAEIKVVEEGSRYAGYGGVRDQRYLGEISGAARRDVPDGHWYFDPVERLLVYRVAYADYYAVDGSGPAEVRFRVTLDYLDRNGNGRYDGAVDDFRKVSLRQQGDGRWID